MIVAKIGRRTQDLGLFVADFRITMAYGRENKNETAGMTKNKNMARLRLSPPVLRPPMLLQPVTVQNKLKITISMHEKREMESFSASS